MRHIYKGIFKYILMTFKAQGFTSLRQTCITYQISPEDMAILRHFNLEHGVS